MVAKKDHLSGLAPLVTPERLRRAAGSVYFKRGEGYFAQGAVRPLRREGEGVEAIAIGSERYRVRLWPEGGALAYDCTCPLGDDREFCKHCVAAGLACHAQARLGGGHVLPAAPSLGDYVKGIGREELEKIVLNQAFRDEELHRRLTILACAAAPGGPDVAAWNGTLDEALEGAGQVGYR